MKNWKFVFHPLIVGLLVLAFAFIVTYGGGGRTFNFDKTVYLTVTDTGDTAQIWKVTPGKSGATGYAPCEYIFRDTLCYNTDDSVLITWTSARQKMKVTPNSLALDSAMYPDTVILSARLGFLFLTPSYKYKITPTSADGWTYRDTVVFGATKYGFSWSRAATNSVAYCCDSIVALGNALSGLSDSVVFEDSTTYVIMRTKGVWGAAGNTRPTRVGFETATPKQVGVVSTAMTAATVIDSLVARFNAVTTLKDTITAQDSGTYIVLQGLTRRFTNATNLTLLPKWSMALAAIADSALDTTSVGYVPTVAQVCDSIVAKINGSAAAPYVTAKDSTTFLTITSDKKGLAFGIDEFANDSAFDDSATVHTNNTSQSRSCDTIDLFQLITDQARPAGLYGNIIIHPSEDTGSDGLNGLGNSDSGKLYFGTRMVIDTNSQYFITADSGKRAALPCTLHIATIYAAANDTLYKPTAILVWAISDTLTDTTGFSPSYRISVDVMTLDH